ncbi:MAG: YceI family protein [Halioglobus sp.]
MNVSRKLSLAVCLVCLALPWSGAWAQWDLVNERSSISFVSIKNGDLGELHGFGSLLGFVSAEGDVQVDIDLDSVETKIDIRNQRMREKLFQTAKFPVARVSAEVEPALIAAAAEGATVTADIPVTLSLHGLSKTVTVPVVVIGEEGGRLQVFSARPVLLSAADFGLQAGVAALVEIAGLKSISDTVPVTLHLVFAPAE